MRPSIGFRFTKHGDEGEPEHTLKYTFLSFFREDPKTVFNELKRKDPHEALWGIFELGSFVTTFMNLGILTRFLDVDLSRPRNRDSPGYLDATEFSVSWA